jgi:hypothetical protein
MKLLRVTIVLMVFLIASCAEEVLQEVETDQSTPLKQFEIEEKVWAQLNQGDVFHWEKESVHTIWSAGMVSDSIFSIGYQPIGFENIEDKMHEIDTREDAWKSVKKEIEALILEEESISRGQEISDINDLKPMGRNRYFPTIFVQLTSKDLLEKLSKREDIRYIEPLGFSLDIEKQFQRSSSGCSGDPNYGINSGDYTTINPGIKKSWNFVDHNIDDAWGQSQGNNIEIAYIDTGGSDSQDNIGSNFNSGYSNGRYVQKYSTKYSGSWWWRKKDSPDDQCGHGTSMAGLGTAPRSNDGNAVGVAYQSDLITIRAVEDVVISNSNEREGVRDALYLAANRSSNKIISMSIGSVTSSSTVRDGIYYAYNKGKLIFAAAGTSFSWTSWWGVIFPANMSQTVAVTGVKSGSSYQRCNTCHDGSAVDFVITMQRSYDNDRTSLGLAEYSNQPKYIGGSSCATATTAGIAALVWAQNPGASRNTVLQALKNASDFYPSRNGNFGWGRIDAQQAVNNM